MDNIKISPDTVEGIKITLTDGRQYTLREKETLGEINKEQEAIFLFDNGQIYQGQSDGQVDEEGDFPLFRPISKVGIALPFGRLVGWAYLKEKRDPLVSTRELLGKLAEQVSQDFRIDLLSVRFKRDEEGKLTDILLSYNERTDTESENGNPQPEGERK